MRYRYYTNNKNIVTCESSFAGKRVRGVAKCSPSDEFELCYGKLLAKARLDCKIAKMRVNKARIRLNNAVDVLDDAEKEYDDAVRYLAGACDEEKQTLSTLYAIVELSK